MKPRGVSASPKTRASVFRSEAVVLAYHIRSSPAHIVYRCPWCDKWHLHGAGGGDGGRASHCEDKQSPLYGKQVNLLFAGTVRGYPAVPWMSEREFVELSNRLAAAGIHGGEWCFPPEKP